MAQRDPKNKEIKKVDKETTTCHMSRVRRDHPRCRSATWICMCCLARDVVIYILVFIKIRSEVLEPQGESKFAISDYFGYWLLQQVVLPYKPRFESYMPVCFTYF